LIVKPPSKPDDYERFRQARDVAGMSAIGKTIASIEETPPSPHDGRPDDERLILHFEDGTALEIEASGGHDGEGYPNATMLDAATLAERRSLALKYEAEQRQAREKREAWMTLSCGERARRLDRHPPAGLFVPSFYENIYLDQLARGPKDRVIRDRCARCRERECPNAPTRILKGTGLRL
jgi:hypothetical protein